MSLAKTYRLPKDLRSLMAKIDAIQISESTLEFEMISESSKSAQRSLSVPTTTTPVSLQTEQLVTTRTPRDGGFSEESPSSSEQELLPSQELISRKFPPSAREVVAQSELLENLLDSAFV
ncbi:unnamed protein product [Cyprideis torosa]|uniref:Uncharacterized protein n=1 Tax=Cyprideis torosa TaxID=163714 RepID=A0A7R8WQJ5_9CRUS|nr:unnamed protein product [Cyprideis torosa]CAG0908004.1 unnamed protein product [Cyprideis torosa]